MASGPAGAGQWARRRAARGAAVAVCAVAMLLAGCVSEAREQEMGDQIAGELNPRLPLVRDPVLNQYVSLLGSRLAKESSRPEVSYRFYIVNTPEENAFALPGGHIYVTRGLIQRTQNASELAAVLAHEIAHVAARHGAQKLERHLRTGTVVSLMYHVLFGREPQLLDREALTLGRKIWSAGHSRRDEREADALAVRYMAGAGIDPNGMRTLLEGLHEEDHSGGSQRLAWFASHPLTEERARWVEEEIAALPGVERSAMVQDLTSYPAFLARIDAVPSLQLLY
jgi:beta-barrel assembly-enhancing protease